MENRKRILDAFENHLSEDYKDFCRRQNLRPTPEGLITYLIDSDLIPATTIRHYTIKQEFGNLFPAEQSHKTKTIHKLSDKFNIPERTIWSILKRKIK